MLTMLTLLVACFSQMDVVVEGPILDVPVEDAQQKDVEQQTQTFLGSVVQSILPVVAKAGLRLVSGLLGLLLERSDIIAISQTRVGIWLYLRWVHCADGVPHNNSLDWLFSHCSSAVSKSSNRAWLPQPRFQSSQLRTKPNNGRLPLFLTCSALADLGLGN
jgi:Topoisomerase II-associated protein PAT1